MIRFPINNAKSIGLSAVAGLAAWKASNFSLDPTHLVEAPPSLLLPPLFCSTPSVTHWSHVYTGPHHTMLALMN